MLKDFLSANQFEYKIILQCLSMALRNENPKLLMAASAICLPVNPMMVSLIHTGMMEVSWFSNYFYDDLVFHLKSMVTKLTVDIIYVGSRIRTTKQ